MNFFLKKICILLFSLLCVVTVTFILMHAIPGDPFLGEQNVPPVVLETLRSHYGLDKPLYVQYGKYILSLLQGNLGSSITYPGRSVNQFIQEGFFISAQLGLQALFLAVPLGISIGTMAAFRRTKWQDQLFMFLSVLVISIPGFVFSSLLQLIFSMKLHWFPVARWDSFAHTILPTLSLAAMPTAYISRLIRANLVEVYQQGYILMAKAKGLSSFRIAMKHALRNGILPVIAYLGPLTSQILTGSFMVEKIFAIGGLGQWMIFSIQARDYPMIMGLTIFFSTFLMICIFITDLIYAWIDPRIRQKIFAYAD